ILIHPEAISNRWTPVMLSVTHLLVLGFAAMVMFGAIQQLIPVLAGVRLPNPQLISRGLYVGLVAGVVCLCAGFYLGNDVLMSIALIMLLATIVAFVLIMMTALWRSEANPASTRGMRLAVLSFLISVTVGLYLLAGHGPGDVPLARHLTSLHLTWGLLGWVALLVMAVSYQVVPMFQITPKYPKLIIDWLAPFVFAALILWSLAEFVWPVWFPDWLGLVGRACVAMGLLTFCFVTFRLQPKRRRKLPDVTLDFFKVALAAMVAAILIWSVPASFLPERDVLIGVLLIPGFTMSVISGMLYKIVPFLVWLHLTNEIDMSRRWERAIPNMKQIIRDRYARVQFYVHLSGLVVYVAGVLTHYWVVRAGGMLLLLSNLVLFGNLLSGVWVYRTYTRE
ncbi:MAG: hypothetical protein HUJ31_08535, partial [Pseudomonadales bacterium]|nr:hypothetical protein [Pseudomonadales bacterium]